MPEVSRTAKSFKNATVALAFYCINLILQFFSRKIFLDYLGTEVLGLNTVAQNLLGFLNLAEMGIGTAVAYCLYKPLYNDDRKSINDIVSVQGWLYRRIAVFIIVASVLLMGFFPIIFGKAEVPLWYSYGSFSVLLFSSLLGYFVNYRQIILSADQKQYKVNYAVKGVTAVKTVTQILAIRCFQNGYVWWMILEIVFAVFTSVVLDLIIKREYPWLKPKVENGKKLRSGYPEVILKVKQQFFHRIGRFAISQFSTLVMYGYVSLTLVAVYGNYALITAGVVSLMASLLNGIQAGIGNLVAERNNEKTISFFWEISSLKLWLSATICFAIYMQGHEFITLWVGEEYLMPEKAFIILVLITFVQLSQTSEAFLVAYGLFQDIWSPIAEAVINIGLSVLLGYYFGLSGILAGVLVSLIFMLYGWKPYFLFTRGFKKKVDSFYSRMLKYLIILGGTFVGCKYFFSFIFSTSTNNWGEWFFRSVLAVLFYGIISLLLMIGVDNPSRQFVKRFTSFIFHIKMDK